MTTPSSTPASVQIDNASTATGPLIATYTYTQNGATVEAQQVIPVDTAGNPLGLALDGTDVTGVSQLSGGAGIRGWLSGIFALLTGGGMKTQIVNGAGVTQAVALDGTDATSAAQSSGGVGVRGWLSSNNILLQAMSTALTAFGTTATNGTQKTQITNSAGTALSIALDGTDATAATQAAGGTGIRGWLSSILYALTSGNAIFVQRTAFTPTGASGTTPVAMTSASTDYTIVPANSTRKYLAFVNNSAATVYINPVGPAWTGSAFAGIPVSAGNGFVWEATGCPNSALHAASGGAAAAYFVLEG